MRQYNCPSLIMHAALITGSYHFGHKHFAPNIFVDNTLLQYIQTHIGRKPGSYPSTHCLNEDSSDKESATPLMVHLEFSHKVIHVPPALCLSPPCRSVS